MPRRKVSRSKSRRNSKRSSDGFKVYVSPKKSPLKLVTRKSPKKSPRKSPKKRLPLRNITNIIHNMARDGMFNEFRSTTPVFTYGRDRFIPQIHSLIRSPQIIVSKNTYKKRRKTPSKKSFIRTKKL